METYQEGAYRTFEANVPADLTGKEGYLAEMLSTGKIQLLTTGVALGVLYQVLEGQTKDWTVRLLGKGGTVKVKAGGVIAGGARVKGANGGKTVDANGTGRVIGVKLATGNSADNDVIEILDVIENLTNVLTEQAQPGALTDNSGGAAADGTIGAVTAPTAIGATLTDSTGLSGTHDDTLAATTVPADLTGGEAPTEAEFNTLLAVVRVMAQNASDSAQKSIELVTAQAANRLALIALTDAVKELSTKVNEHNTALIAAGVYTA